MVFTDNLIFSLDDLPFTLEIIAGVTDLIFIFAIFTLSTDSSSLTDNQIKMICKSEKKIYSSKKNVELVLAKIYDIDDEDIQKEYMTAFNGVISFYDELKINYSMI